MSETQNLGLPYMEAGQAQKHVTHNEALRLLDRVVQLAVQDLDLTAPPDTPAEGQRWIVKAAATDGWAGHDNQIAAWQDGAWEFTTPSIGWLAYVVDDENLVAWDGTAWHAVSAGSGGGSGGDLTELQNMLLLGVGTEADTTNPVSARLNNVLWAAQTVAEGGDGTLRYKLSKESADKTLSFLFQDDFVGCAEIGLTGDDDFHFKVSPDGTAWLEAIRIDRATGRVSFPSGGAREVLTANRTYYVRTDGSDTNSGLADSSSDAFLTIQKAINTIAALDFSGYTITIQIGDGTYTNAAMVGINVGQKAAGNLVIRGNSSTPSNVLISTTSASAITVGSGAMALVKDLKVQTAVSGTGLRSLGVLNYSNIVFGTCANAHLSAENNGVAQSSGNTSITGGAQEHWNASNGGLVVDGGRTIALTGTPAFSVGFAWCDTGGKMQVNSNTFSGAASGNRYNVTMNGVIQTFGGGANYLPGSVAGTVTTGGQYA